MQVQFQIKLALLSKKEKKLYSHKRSRLMQNLPLKSDVQMRLQMLGLALKTEQEGQYCKDLRACNRVP